MTSTKHVATRRELTVAEIETLEAIELPTREAMTGLTIGAAICLSVNLNVDLNLGGGCSNSCP